MRADAGRVVLAPQSVGQGFAIGLGWLLSLPRRWWGAWLQTAARLAAHPATFVNHR
jgi:hypothetical protein